MNVAIAYANQQKPVWLKLQVPAGSTVNDVIQLSGILQHCPEINLKSQKVGIFGKLTKLDAMIENGSRIEIYNPIVADPESARRKDC